VYINIFKSPFNDTHETVEVKNGAQIREVLKFDYGNSIIIVNGNEVDENYILKENDICTIREFPKATAIVIASFAIPLLFITDQIVEKVTGKNIIGWIKEGLMNWLMPDAGASNQPDDLKTIPQLQGAKNQSNKNKPIPMVLGKHLFTPMYIGSPYTEIGGKDGEDQYYNALYLLGWGELDVRDIKLGPVSGLAQNKAGKTEGSIEYIKGDGFCDPSFDEGNPQLELRQGASEVSLYPQKVVEERLSIELLNIENKDDPSENKRLEPIRFSAKNPQKVQVEITFNQGLISYDDKGNKKDASVGILVEWRANHNIDTWHEFGRFGTSNSDKDNHSPTDYSSATKTTTIKRQKAKVMRFVAEKSFSYNDVKDHDRTIEIRVIRTTTKKADDTNTADTVYLSAIRTWCFDNEATEKNNGVMVLQVPMIQKYRDKTARLGFRIKATENLQGTINALNCIVWSKARTWDGSVWSTKETPTSNPASLALKMLQSPALGNNAYTGDSENMLDLDSFGEFYEWCDERNYTCNGVLTNEKRVDEVLNMILSTGRGIRILNGSKYAVLIDKERKNPVMILNDQNVLEAGNHKSFEDLPDGYSIKFINELDGYQETEVYVMADGSGKTKPESRIEAVEMPFITDYHQIFKNGRYLLACRRLRPEIWVRKVSVVGYLIGIGDRVEVQDYTITVGIGEGAMITGLQTAGGLISEIQTDGQFDVSDITNKQFGIKIMHFDGIHDGVIRTIQVPITEPGLYSNFVFNPPISLPFIPQKGDLVAFGEYGKITAPAICFGKKPGGDGTFELTLMPYQEGIYTADEGAIPSYNDFVTTPQQPVLPPSIPGYVEIINDRISDVAGRTEDINNRIYRLILSIQNIILDVDHRGNIFADNLPFTTKATLYHGSIVVNAMQRYPGAGMNLFDPMVGDFVTIVHGIIFSLVDPPAGVSIDEEGIITVSKEAELDSENYIIVQAEYFGQVYKTILYIKGVVYTPRYLGACYAETGTKRVEIKIGNETVTYIARQGDWVAYLGEDVPNSIWKEGYCMRWTGIQWEQVQMEADGNFDSNPYIDALLDLTENAPRGTFLSILVRDLIAKTAMIERLFSHKLRIQTLTDADGKHEGAIYGGGYDENGNNPNNLAGFYLGTDGELNAVGGTFTGRIEAYEGHFTGITGYEMKIQGGTINIGPLLVSDEMTSQGSPTVYQASTPLVNFVNGYLSTIPPTPIGNSDGSAVSYRYTLPHGGQYGGTPLLYINFIKQYVWVSDSSYVLRYTASFYNISGSLIATRVYDGHSNTTNTIGQTVTINAGPGGATFKLTGLPESPDPSKPGTLWVDKQVGNVIKIVL